MKRMICILLILALSFAFTPIVTAETEIGLPFGSNDVNPQEVQTDPDDPDVPKDPNEPNEPNEPNDLDVNIGGQDPPEEIDIEDIKQDIPEGTLIPGKHETEIMSFDGAEYVPGQIIVSFEQGEIRPFAQLSAVNLKSVMSSALSDMPGELDAVVRLSELADTIAVIDLPPDVTIGEAVAEYNKNPLIKHAQPNFLYDKANDLVPAKIRQTVEYNNQGGNFAPMSAIRRPNNPLVGDSPNLWNASHLDAINTFEAWELLESAGLTDRQMVRVAVIDTQVDLNHEGLKGNLMTNFARNIQSKNLNNPNLWTRLDPPDSHGTHVTGLIAGKAGKVGEPAPGTPGVAAGFNNNIVQVIPINVFEWNTSLNSYGRATTAAIVTAVNYAITSNVGARVINMSLGSGTPDTLLEQAIEQAHQAGVIVVAAAGNGEPPSFIGYDDKPVYPSDFETVVSVISVSHTTNVWQSFSWNLPAANWVKWVDPAVNPNVNPRSLFSCFGPDKNISAPGAIVWSTVPVGQESLVTTSRFPAFFTPGYDVDAGTSMSSPIVAAVAAMVRYANPSLTPVQVKDILYTTATDVFKPGFDDETGYGVVNAEKAVEKAIGTIKIPAFRQFRIALIEGSDGDIGLLLDEKQIPYDSLSNFTAEHINSYDVLFYGNGTGGRVSGQVIRSFISQGGVVYASGRTIEDIKSAFPERTIVTENRGQESILAKLADDGIKRTIGKSTVNLTLKGPNWSFVTSNLQPDVDVYVEGKPSSAGKDYPLAFSFPHGVNGGRVLYTSMEPDANLSDNNDVLAYLVERAHLNSGVNRLNQWAADYGFEKVSPVFGRLGKNAASAPPYKFTVIPGGQDFAIINDTTLGDFTITLTAPDGNEYNNYENDRYVIKRDQPNYGDMVVHTMGALGFRVENPIHGDWSFRVRSINSGIRSFAAGVTEAAINQINLDKSYLVMRVDDSIELTAVDKNGKNITKRIDWEAINPKDGNKSTIVGDIEKLTNSVKVTANGTGTVIIRASYGKSQTTECRIDIVPKDQPLNKSIGSVRFLQTGASINAHNKNGIRVPIQLVLAQNNLSTSSLGTGLFSSNLPDTKVIRSVSFINPVADNLFTATAVDDRFIQIVPKTPNIFEDRRSSVATGLRVDFTDTTYLEASTNSLTINISRSLPTVRVSPIRFNSFFPDASVPFSITSSFGRVTNISLPAGQQDNNTVILNADQTIRLNPRRAANPARLALVVEIEGFDGTITQTVSVSVRMVRPAVRLSARTVTMQRSAALRIIGNNISSLNVVGNENYTVTQPDGFGNFTLSYLGAGNVSANTGLTLRAGFRDTIETVDLRINVRRPPANTRVRLSSRTVTLNTLESGNKFARVSALLTPVDASLDDFDIQSSSKVINAVRIGNNAIEVKLSSNQTGTYSVDLINRVTGNRAARLTVRVVDQTPSISLRARGVFNIIDPDSMITLTPGFRNYNYMGQGVNIVNPDGNKYFVIEEVSATGAVTLRMRDDLPEDQFKPLMPVPVVLRYDSPGGNTGITSNPLNIRPRQVNPRLQSTRQINLLSNDRFSEGIVDITVLNMPTASMTELVINRESDRALYDIRKVQYGQYAIFFKNRDNSNAGKGGTVQLGVLFEGSDRPVNINVHINVT